MKKLIAAAIVTALTVSVSASAFGAVHNSGTQYNDFTYFGTGNTINLPTMGNWHYVGQEKPSAVVNGNFNKNDRSVGAEYYKDDQTFVEFNAGPSTGSAELFGSLFDPSAGTSFFKGSFKMDSGFFLGGDFADNDIYMISPGYFFELDNGYLALSADYLNTPTQKGVNGIAADFRYYLNNMRFFGQLYYDVDSDLIGNDGLYLDANADYQLNKNWVIGMGFKSSTPNAVVDTRGSYLAGLTYSKNKLTVDYNLTRTFDADQTTSDLLGMYQIKNNLKLGAEYVNNYADVAALWHLKAKYDMKKGSLLFDYQPYNKTVSSPDSILSLAFSMKI